MLNVLSYYVDVPLWPSTERLFWSLLEQSMCIAMFNYFISIKTLPALYKLGIPL